MIKHDKKRIFKRFMEGEDIEDSAYELCDGAYMEYCRKEVEQAIRECVWDEIAKEKKNV